MGKHMELVRTFMGKATAFQGGSNSDSTLETSALRFVLRLRTHRPHPAARGAMWCHGPKHGLWPQNDLDSSSRVIYFVCNLGGRLLCFHFLTVKWGQFYAAHGGLCDHYMRVPGKGGGR